MFLNADGRSTEKGQISRCPAGCSVSGPRRSASGGRSGRAQLPPRRRPGRQLRLAARPPTRSDVVRHAKCKHAVGVLTAAYDYRPKLLH